MNKFVIKVVLFIPFLVCAQIQKTKILNICDAVTKSNIENVYIINDNQVFLLEDGKMEANNLDFSNNKCFKVSHVSYILHEICEAKDTVFLTSNITEFNEVVLFADRKNNKNLKIIKPKPTISNLHPQNYGKLGYSLKGLKAIKIPVPKNMWIKNIKIYTNNVAVRNLKNTRGIEQKFTENAPFLYNILAFDDSIGAPGKDYYFDSFYICKKEIGAPYILININQSFENEIVLVFKPLQDEDYEKMNLFSAPFIETIGVGIKTDFTPFAFDNQKKLWIKDAFLQNRQQTYKIEVEYLSE
uniref:hypothetical protein n=1 Tax=Flavobacterium sp. TaxID=239 RepID=UPI004049C2FD